MAVLGPRNPKLDPAPVRDETDREQGARKERLALDSALQKLNQIMKGMGLTGLGTRTSVRKPITVSVADVTFPGSGTNRVEVGDDPGEVVLKSRAA